MKSIKPGRGPSMRSAVIGIAIAIFGILWTIVALNMTSDMGDTFDSFGGMGVAGAIFPVFGVVFVVIAVAGVIYDFKNATGKKRFSEFDVVDGEEEPDPLNERFGAETSEFSFSENRSEAGAFCPYCGVEINDDYLYCNRCGKRLPERK